MENKTQDIAVVDAHQMMEKVILAGDLSKMDPKDRVNYYLKTCESMGMNPMTKPFDLITLNGKMVLYPNRSGTDQLRKLGNVSLQIIDRKKENDVYIVTARASMPNGRADESTGVVPISNLKGDMLANALMKAETKAKRRVTLSIMGLGWIDESEVGTIKGAELHKMDLDTGEVIDVQPKQQQQKDSAPKKWKLSKQEYDHIISGAPNKGMDASQLWQWACNKFGLKKAWDEMSEKDYNSIVEFLYGKVIDISPEFEKAMNETPDLRDMK